MASSRNPSYVGMLITSLGWVLTFRSGVAVLLVASLLVPLVARIHAEEQLLRSHFGAEYATYCALSAGRSAHIATAGAAEALAPRCLSGRESSKRFALALAPHHHNSLFANGQASDIWR